MEMDEHRNKNRASEERATQYLVQIQPEVGKGSQLASQKRYLVSVNRDIQKEITGVRLGVTNKRSWIENERIDQRALVRTRDAFSGKSLHWASEIGASEVASVFATAPVQSLQLPTRVPFWHFKLRNQCGYQCFSLNYLANTDYKQNNLNKPTTAYTHDESICTEWVLPMSTSACFAPVFIQIV